MKLEIRVSEVRPDADGKSIVGTIPYGKRSHRLGNFYEEIRQGAFDEAIRSADISMLWAHDLNALLGRTASGTLQLSSDSSGLHYRCLLPDTTLGRDVSALIARRDIPGVSFGFSVPKGGDEWRQDLRELTVTPHPAYPDTTIALRSCPPELLTGKALSESDRIRLELKLALRLRKKLTNKGND